jgi:nitrite reductase/ring-hydroxylating ferredoxin subunit
MAVYVAFALVVLHVAYGALMLETHPAYAWLVGLAASLVIGLHLAAGWRSTALDRAPVALVDHDGERWIDAGPPERIPLDRALPVRTPGGERLAVIRHDGGVSAIHGVCAHQGGPLYEGKVIDGCLTCPWHGWQYRPGDGQSPPPFTEKLPTHRVCIGSNGHVLVHPDPSPPGTAHAPARLEERDDA